MSESTQKQVKMRMTAQEWERLDNYAATQQVGRAECFRRAWAAFSDKDVCGQTPYCVEVGVGLLPGREHSVECSRHDLEMS